MVEKVTVSLSPETHGHTKALVDEMGVSFSFAVEEALRHWNARQAARVPVPEAVVPEAVVPEEPFVEYDTEPSEGPSLDQRPPRRMTGARRRG